MSRFMDRKIDRTTREDRRRARCRARVKAHRARLGDGRACAVVEFTGSVVDLLVKSGWLRDTAACDREHVGRAITNLLNDIAEHS
jgi:hypothetical protein